MLFWVAFINILPLLAVILPLLAVIFIGCVASVCWSNCDFDVERNTELDSHRQTSFPAGIDWIALWSVRLPVGLTGFSSCVRSCPCTVDMSLRLLVPSPSKGK